MVHFPSVACGPRAGEQMMEHLREGSVGAHQGLTSDSGKTTSHNGVKEAWSQCVGRGGSGAYCKAGPVHQAAPTEGANNCKEEFNKLIDFLGVDW